MNENETNPLLKFEFRIPFDRITAGHVEPAAERLLLEARARLDALVSETAPRTFENTMLALDRLTEQLEYAMGIVRHLESVVTTPELRAAYHAVQPGITAFYSSLPLNAGLWNAIQAFAATNEAQHLEGTHQRFLKKTVESFRRHGAELDAAGKTRMAEIDAELARLTMKFGENVLDSTNEFEFVIHVEAQLAGLPPAAVAAARADAASKNLPEPSWRFTLQAPSYTAVSTYLDDDGVRETMYKAYATRAAHGEHDNRELTRSIIKLRQEKAALLGFTDFSDLVTADRMAHNGARAQQFLEDLRVKTEARFHQENAELRDFAGHALEPWQLSYYAEKQRAALYDFDEELLRPYFPLERVIHGMFEIVGRLYGIQVTEQPGAPVWDPAVRYYEIRDDSGLLGAFYADWFPRENKRGGAWMDAFITGVGGDPQAGLICGNLTPPVDGKPALLSHRDVETIFHEFGHLLHHCLSRVQVRSLAGANVAWDFVELPSQIMENWCWEREALDLFARHHETGQPIPEDLFQKMTRARRFRAANQQMRQLGFGLLDLALHRQYSPDRDGDVAAYARRISQPFTPAPLPEYHASIVSFTHLFASPVAYAAGYYSYKWAEVLDADAFTKFLRQGIFSREAGLEFRNGILSKGDSEDPAELYRGFMGRDPDPNALLERFGLLAA